MTERQYILAYLLQMADNDSILGHRLGENCGHGPVLEQDIAITNIALDLIGQARSLYQMAAEVAGDERTEDQLAYLRDAWDFKNLLLVEQENTDFAHIIVRQFLFDVFHLNLLENLINSKIETLSAFAQKSLKEVKYHIKYSGDWIVRMGDGTEESKRRLQVALDKLWPYFGEVFVANDTDKYMYEHFDVKLPELLLPKCIERVNSTFAEATIQVPDMNYSQNGGKEGVHTEHLGYILADMQFLQRSYPNNVW